MEFKARYVLIDSEKGSVVWHDQYAEAVKAQREYGGVLLDTTKEDPEYVRLCLENARRNK